MKRAQGQQTRKVGLPLLVGAPVPLGRRVAPEPSFEEHRDGQQNARQKDHGVGAEEAAHLNINSVIHAHLLRPVENYTKGTLRSAMRRGERAKDTHSARRAWLRRRCKRVLTKPGRKPVQRERQAVCDRPASWDKRMRWTLCLFYYCYQTPKAARIPPKLKLLRI